MLAALQKHADPAARYLAVLPHPEGVIGSVWPGAVVGKPTIYLSGPDDCARS